MKGYKKETIITPEVYTPAVTKKEIVITLDENEAELLRLIAAYPLTVSRAVAQVTGMDELKFGNMLLNLVDLIERVQRGC
jgi:hypothetical protein